MKPVRTIHRKLIAVKFKLVTLKPNDTCLLFVPIHAAFTVVLLHHLLQYRVKYLVEVLLFVAIRAKISMSKQGEGGQAPQLFLVDLVCCSTEDTALSPISYNL